MKVLLLSRYGRLGASSRLRSYQYIPYLKAQGIDVTVNPLLGDDYIRALYKGRRKHITAILGAYFSRLGHLHNSHRFDLLWIEKELLPWIPAWGEAIIARLGVPYVVDYDDAIFHNYDMHSSGIVRTLLRTKIDAVMRRAALVIAGNNYLADRARKAGAKRVECLPTVIDLDRYPSALPPNNKIFTIGWVGKPVTSKYLHLIHAALAEVCEAGNAHLVVVGSDEPKLDGVPLMNHPWSEETEVADIQNFDVGIMPLPDEPWERGKCGYKLIQYMACGRPVVASPVGVNQQIVEEGINGFLAATTEEWVYALSVLRDSNDLRATMGKAGRVKVEQQYCIQVTAPRLSTLLRSVGRQI